MIEIEIYRVQIGLHYGRHLKVKGITCSNFFELLIIMSLLLIAGIEPNPGPISENSVNSSTLSVSFDDLNAIKNKFSVVHYNVQSISDKLDIIESK